MERRRTRQIHVGAVAVGADAPISVQSMTITKTANVEGTLQQIYALAAAGCDIVRCTCNEAEAAEGLAQIVPRSPVPIIADIHHQYRMALAALETARPPYLDELLLLGRDDSLLGLSGRLFGNHRRCLRDRRGRALGHLLGRDRCKSHRRGDLGRRKLGRRLGQRRFHRRRRFG